MADYNFWADLLDTWQSTSDGIKALAIVTPPLFLVCVIALLLGHRARMKAPPLSTTQVQPPLSATDREALTVLTQLHQNLRELMPLHGQNGLKLLEGKMAENSGDPDLRAEVRKIVMEEYLRGAGPYDALLRVRAYVQARRASNRR